LKIDGFFSKYSVIASEKSLFTTPSTSWEPSFIWLDCFESDWWLQDSETLQLFSSQKVVVVSSELHSRNPSEMWGFLKNKMKVSNFNFGICTDKPKAFRDFIYD
jgi:hypothetical protein